MKDKTLHNLFEFGITIKFINGCLELIAAICLLVLSSQTLESIKSFIFSMELVEDPKDFIANALLHVVQNVSLDAKTFLIIYLFIHGIIKVGIVIALWRKRMWAYPVGGVILGLLTLYQLYLAVSIHSIFPWILSVIDVIIILLLRYEYKKISRKNKRSR
jgi:uncharacterized membrane protein